MDQTIDTPAAAQESARTAALGPIEGACCEPATETPCVTCLVPDDVPYEPSEADLLWYRGLCREREDRLWSERIEAGPTVVEMLFDEANRLIDSDDADRRGLGEEVARMAHEARSLEAKSWEQYRDRLAAMMDSRL